ncbi:MAG: YggS family pyridoxal phosphate-dependent enzyme [Oscillospiraceae bacterium]|nr:YggS family pyridoxal phosphate-dependent enzyme [Oscillospiraceae bacterium]
MLAAKTIAENVGRIRREIEVAAEGRRVLLVAATKMNDAAAVRAAIAAGVDACGENHVQELLEKDAVGAYAGAPLHFIGHLQRNKVNKVVGRADLIQSVDSAELLELINRRAQAMGIIQNILIEINVGGEQQKSGIEPEELPDMLKTASECAGVRVRGLMCVPPAVSGEENRDNFTKMKQLFVDNGGKKYDNISMDFLSMGMTADFAEAIRQGANMVRIGSAIFGARDYSAAY